MFCNHNLKKNVFDPLHLKQAVAQNMLWCNTTHFEAAGHISTFSLSEMIGTWRPSPLVCLCTRQLSCCPTLPKHGLLECSPERRGDRSRPPSTPDGWYAGDPLKGTKFLLPWMMQCVLPIRVWMHPQTWCKLEEGDTRAPPKASGEEHSRFWRSSETKVRCVSSETKEGELERICEQILFEGDVCTPLPKGLDLPQTPSCPGGRQCFSLMYDPCHGIGLWDRIQNALKSILRWGHWTLNSVEEDS